jgi:hypothetical protein
MGFNPRTHANVWAPEDGPDRMFHCSVMPSIQKSQRATGK